MAPLQFLVLGGTSWLGGTVAALARDRGHEVTCLARGESGSVPPGVRHVRADRARPGAYDSVACQPWDVVLDVSWQPELVRSALSALAPTCDHWIYVSSVSVYADDTTPGSDETAPVHQPWPGRGHAEPSDYAGAKVSCETACQIGMGEHLMVARAGLIAGPGDRSDRFGYWPARFDRVSDDSEAVLVPPLDTPAQVVDVRDLAAWLVDSGERRRCGVYDAVGPVRSLGDVLTECARATQKQPLLVEVDQEWLQAQNITPWMGTRSLPLWLPMPDHAGTMRRSNDRAVRAGLDFRPLASTVADTLAWERDLGLNRSRQAGLAPWDEQTLLGKLSQTTQ